MAIPMNLNPGGYMAPPKGYPIRIFPAQDSTLQGVITKTVSTVTAIVQAEKGAANCHLAIYSMPTASGGNDNALVAQVDAIGITSNLTTMTLTVPATTSPACYVLRLWCDSITGSNQDAISRDGVTAVTLEPKIPTAVKVQSVVVS